MSWVLCDVSDWIRDVSDYLYQINDGRLNWRSFWSLRVRNPSIPSNNRGIGKSPYILPPIRYTGAKSVLESALFPYYPSFQFSWFTDTY